MHLLGTYYELVTPFRHGGNRNGSESPTWGIPEESCLSEVHTGWCGHSGEARFLLEAFLACPRWAQSYSRHLANASGPGEKVAVEVGEKKKDIPSKESSRSKSSKSETIRCAGRAVSIAQSQARAIRRPDGELFVVRGK